LFARDSGAIGVLDGTRAVAVSWVLAFHSVLFLPVSLASGEAKAGRTYVVPPAYTQMTDSWFMAPVVIGETGVDMFFLLSGFLIAYLLGREYRRSGSINYCRFLFRRWLRIFPAFITAIVIYSFATFQACAHW
jgi:peptidoglycan/LPS O-acetylase OafA/YrhL